MLSATPSAASPQTMIRPFCIMNPAAGPTFPPTISVPPFMAIPARVEAFPRTTTVPARIDAAAALPASPSTMTRPVPHALGHAPADSALDLDRRAVVQARRVIARRPIDRQVEPLGHRHAQVVPGLGMDQADPRRLASIDDRPDQPMDLSDREGVAIEGQRRVVGHGHGRGPPVRRLAGGARSG